MISFIRANRLLIVNIFLFFSFVMTLITWMTYYIDKRKAIKNKWRTKESILLSLPWLLGSIGGILGLYVTRHKTKHWYFKVNNIFAVIVQMILFLLIIIL